MRPRHTETNEDRDRESRFCLGLGTCLLTGSAQKQRDAILFSAVTNRDN